MDPYLKLVLSFALQYPRNPKKRDKAIDTFFVHFLVLPFQRSWRKKTPLQKKYIHFWILETIVYTKIYKDI